VACQNNPQLEKIMNFRDAVNNCKVRGYIARPSYHADIPDNIKFWKNHNAPLECRVAWQDQIEKDWECYDPESVETSIVG